MNSRIKLSCTGSSTVITCTSTWSLCVQLFAWINSHKIFNVVILDSLAQNHLSDNECPCNDSSLWVSHRPWLSHRIQLKAQRALCFYNSDNAFIWSGERVKLVCFFPLHACLYKHLKRSQIFELLYTVGSFWSIFACLDPQCHLKVVQ